MAVQFIPEREMRGPGCSDACRVVRCFQAGVFGRQEILVHSADAHERYGREQVTGAPERLIRTGILEVDLERYLVTVDGQEVNLSGIERRMAVALAERFDCLVLHPDFVRSVWQTDTYGPSERHLIRAHLSRLRARLGPRAGGLIQTVPDIGLRLVAVPIGATAPPLAGSSLRGRWSLKHDACVVCGTTERSHYGGGVCTACGSKEQKKRRRAQLASTP